MVWIKRLQHCIDLELFCYTKSLTINQPWNSQHMESSNPFRLHMHESTKLICLTQMNILRSRLFSMKDKQTCQQNKWLNERSTELSKKNVQKMHEKSSSYFSCTKTGMVIGTHLYTPSNLGFDFFLSGGLISNKSFANNDPPCWKYSCIPMQIERKTSIFSKRIPVNQL